MSLVIFLIPVLYYDQSSAHLLIFNWSNQTLCVEHILQLMSNGKLHKNQCTPILNLMGPVLNKLFSMKGGFLGFNSHIYHQRVSLIIISFDKIPDIEQGYWCNNNCVTQMLKESWGSEWALWVPTPSRSVREWSTLQDFRWLYPGLKQLEIQWNLHYFEQKRWS